MDMSVKRDNFDVELGFQYYVSFKPHLPLANDSGEVHTRIPVEASLSVSENGDLADISFVLPKLCRSEQALAFIRKQTTAQVIPPRVLLTLPGYSGDAVATAAANLDLDLAGRIVGMEIHWMPADGALS
jgi:hypothetical protein